MILVGIDPGFTGAIALLEPGSWTLKVHDMPVLPGPKGKTELDLRGLAEILIPSNQGRNVAAVERVSAMPSQGVSSVFRFGQTFGAIQMAVAAHGYETHYPPPSQWKKHFGLSSDKDTSRLLAMQRFPEAADHFKLKKHDGRAEAALLALYAYEKILGLGQVAA
jgi:crossover junction endodeoxyribonuclease RuvC